MKVSTAPYDPAAAQQLIDQRSAYEQSLGLPSQTGTFQPRPSYDFGAAQQLIDQRDAYSQSLGIPSQTGTFQPRPMAGAPSMMPMMPTNFFGAPRMNANLFDRRGGMRGPMQNRFMPQVLPSMVGAPDMFGMMPQPDFMSPRGGMTGGARPAQMPFDMAALSANPMGGAAGFGGVAAMPQPNFMSPRGGMTGGARPPQIPQQMQGLLY